jgi:DNA topoisomerase VI subunit B
MMQRLERTTFETSRAAEYFDARELQAMTGQPKTDFASVVLKELVDNALDACETAGVKPEVCIRVNEDAEEGRIDITVLDNGPGVPPKVVDKVLDYSVRVSDKAAYRSPTRGAQGNALKTVVGIPYALGVEEPVVIEGRGTRHEIRPWVDPAGTLRIKHAKSEARPRETYKSAVTLATTWEDQDFEPEYWAAAFAMFNPHATITFEHARDGDASCETYKRAVGEGWRKYTPTDLTSAHWYSSASLKRLVFSHIAHAEHNGGRDLPLGEFIRQFKGLSNPSKAKAVRAELDGIDHLSNFASEPERVTELLAAMQERSKAPNHRVFGRVGPDRFEAIFERAYNVEEFNYQWAKDYTAGGLPYIFEIAVAVTDAPGHLYYGINHTASFDDPLEGTLLAGPKFKTRGIRGFLQHGHALPEGAAYYSFRSPAPVAVAVHIITPAPVFLDRGKTRVQLEEEG